MALTDGGIIYLKLDGNSNDSVRGLTATDTSITYPTGKINQGAEFNSSSDNIRFAFNSAFETQEFALSFWIKTTDTTANVNVISRYEDATKRSFRSLLNNTSGRVSFLWYDTSNNNTALVNSGVINDGNWHHILVTAKHNGIALISNVYTDNVLTTGPTNHGNIQIKNTGGARLDIGGNNGIETTGFVGMIDEIYFRGIETSSLDRDTLWNGGNGSQWPFGVTAKNTGFLNFF